MTGLAALLVAVAFATSVLSAVLGMAGGMVLMGVLAVTLPVQAAMIVHGVTQLFANGFRAFLLRDRIYTAGLFRYALGALLSLGLFSWLALVVSGPVLFLVLGGIPLALSFLPRRHAPRIETRAGAIACGALVTAAHLLAGVSGPLLDVFFVRTKLDRFEVIATKAVTQSAGHALKILYFGAIVPGANLDLGLPIWIYPALIACTYLGTRAGGRVLESWSDTSFRVWTGRVVISLSLLYVWRGVVGLGLPSPW